MRAHTKVRKKIFRILKHGALSASWKWFGLMKGTKRWKIMQKKLVGKVQHLQNKLHL